MTTLSFNARRVVRLGISDMEWNNIILTEREQIWCGLVWINEYLDSIAQYPQTFKVWQKIERELTKAFNIADDEKLCFYLL